MAAGIGLPGGHEYVFPAYPGQSGRIVPEPPAHEKLGADIATGWLGIPCTQSRVIVDGTQGGSPVQRLRNNVESAVVEDSWQR